MIGRRSERRIRAAAGITLAAILAGAVPVGAQQAEPPRGGGATQLAHHEAGALQAQGLPGVWVWGFWDGWWPGYLFSVANNHNPVGRFYETFGNSLAGTFRRYLGDVEFVGESVTTRQWYRPSPPDSTPAGSWIVRGDRGPLAEAAAELGLGFVAHPEVPDVERHEVDLPRLAVWQPWTSTQDAGWVRYTFDTIGVPYRLIAEDADDGEDDEKPGAEGLVLSGWVKDPAELDGKPAILDVPMGRGRVVLFSFNPLHRYLNHSDFRFAFNAILHWNDLP